jgi:hypothetical protein
MVAIDEHGHWSAYSYNHGGKTEPLEGDVLDGLPVDCGGKVFEVHYIDVELPIPHPDNRAVQGTRVEALEVAENALLTAADAYEAITGGDPDEIWDPRVRELQEALELLRRERKRQE